MQCKKGNMQKCKKWMRDTCYLPGCLPQAGLLMGFRDVSHWCHVRSLFSCSFCTMLMRVTSCASCLLCCCVVLSMWVLRVVWISCVAYSRLLRTPSSKEWRSSSRTRATIAPVRPPVLLPFRAAYTLPRWCSHVRLRDVLIPAGLIPRRGPSNICSLSPSTCIAMKSMGRRRRHVHCGIPRHAPCHPPRHATPARLPRVAAQKLDTNDSPC